MVLSNERKVLAIDYLCDQAKRAEMSVFRRRMNTKNLALMIDTAAQMFINVSKRHADERALSQAERNRRIAQADSLEEARGQIKELNDDAKEKIKVFQTKK